MRDMEAATYCPLFLPKGSDIVKEILAIGRHYSNMIEKHPEQERGSPHIWFFDARSRIGELSPPDQGQTEALRWLRTITESTDVQELATWIKGCRHLPTFAKPGKPDRDGSFLQSKTDHLQMAEEGHGLSAPTLHAAGYKRKKGKRGGSESKTWSGTRWSCAERKPHQEEHSEGTWQGSSATRSCQTQARERAERAERRCSN